MPDYIVDIICLFFICLSVWIWSYFGSYLKKKGENVATKEDIEELTNKVESVKKDYELIRKTEGRKFLLKYEACLEALKVVDEFYLINMKLEIEAVIGEDITVKDPESLGKIAREVHSLLVVSCDNKETLDLYRRCVWIEWPENMSLVVDFRWAIRKELGFSSSNMIVDSNKDKAWIGILTSNITK